MKIRLVKEAEGPDGVLPVGTEIEHQKSWIHCLPGYLNAAPIAEPIDDEAKAKVATEMEARKSRLREMPAIIRRPGLNTDAKNFNRELATAYEGEALERRTV